MTAHPSLIQAAWEARRHALTPFSGFAVGAALETPAGILHTGCNIENVTLGLTVCAERVALWKALSTGDRRFVRLCVATDAEHPAPPCGACRQLLWEYCGDLPVILINRSGLTREHRLSDLLPHPFDSRALGRDRS